jgi:hypothetical protein
LRIFLSRTRDIWRHYRQRNANASEPFINLNLHRS